MADKFALNWGALVQQVLSSQGQETSEYKKLIKHTVTLAAASAKNSDKRELKDELKKFLKRSRSYVVDNGRVAAVDVEEPQKHQPAPEGSEPQSAITNGTHAAASALKMLGAQQAKKRKKRSKDVEKAAKEMASLKQAARPADVDGDLHQTDGAPIKHERHIKKDGGRSRKRTAQQPEHSSAVQLELELPTNSTAPNTGVGAELPSSPKDLLTQAGRNQQRQDDAAAGKKAKRQKVAKGHGQPQRSHDGEQQPAHTAATTVEQPQGMHEAMVPLIRSEPAEDVPLLERAQGAPHGRKEATENKEKKKKKKQKQEAAVVAQAAAKPERTRREGDAEGRSTLGVVQQPQQRDQGEGEEGGHDERPAGDGNEPPGHRASHGAQQGKKRKQAGTGGMAASEVPECAQQEGEEGGEAPQGEEGQGRKKRKGGQQASAPPSQAPAQAGDGTPVLPLGATADVKRWREANKREDVKSGPFSKAEKDTLRQAVVEFAERHGHSTSDFSWLFDRTQKRKARNEGAWSVIAEALPQRTYKSVWAAGTRMFHPGNYQGRFTVDEDVRLQQLVRDKGSAWKDIGAALGRMPEACRDRWKEIRLGSEKKVGHWSEEEVQKLQEAVQEYVALKRAHAQPASSAGALGGEVLLTLDSGGSQATPAAASGDRPLFEDGAEGGSQGGAGTPGRRQVLDDIDWSVVSRRVGTRSDIQCLEKWYSQLCPSMVERGEWGSGDDRRLLRAIYSSGAAQDYELDWGALVAGREAGQTRRRWRLMLKCVPGSRDMDFREVVDHLVDQYMPQLKEQQQQGQE